MTPGNRGDQNPVFEPELVVVALDQGATLRVLLSGPSVDTDAAETHPPNLCAPSDDLRQGAAVEIWSIGYHVDGADLANDTLTRRGSSVRSTHGYTEA